MKRKKIHWIPNKAEKCVTKCGLIPDEHHDAGYTNHRYAATCEKCNPKAGTIPYSTLVKNRVYQILKEKTKPKRGLRIKQLLDQLHDEDQFRDMPPARATVNQAVRELMREGLTDYYAHEGLNHWFADLKKRKADRQKHYPSMYVYQTDVVQDLLEMVAEYVGEAEHQGELANMTELSNSTVEDIEEWKKKRKELLKKDFAIFLDASIEV